MPEYVYRAITKEGVIVKNRVESGNKQTLIKRLKEGNLTPIDVVQVGYGRKKVNTKRKNVTDIDEIMRTANSSSVIQGRGRKKTILCWKSKPCYFKTRKTNYKRHNGIYSKFLFIEKSRFQQYTCIKHNNRKYGKPYF